ncbi:MAG: restriction endonuclease FokI C-terminal domain-containing protein [Candidatus Methanospirareceae archaeon]
MELKWSMASFGGRRKKENEKYKQVFPEGEFTIDLEGEKLPNKKVDWKMGRVSIGPKIMYKYFQKDDIVLISKSADSRTVTVRKKESEYGPTKRLELELPLVSKLRESQRNSDNPTVFEKTLVDAFNELGFSAKHIGGRDEPDIFINDNFNIILDSKTTKEGVITERYINFDAMDRYKEREKYQARYIGVVAPGFSEGYIRETATKRGIILIETEAICRILQNHATYPYEPNRIAEILFESGKSIITPEDIPPSTVDQEKLIDVVAKTIPILKHFEKANVAPFSGNNLRIALLGQGLNYGIDEIENALKFLSTKPFSILQKQDDKYSPTGNIDSILKKLVYYYKHSTKWVVEYERSGGSELSQPFGLLGANALGQHGVCGSGYALTQMLGFASHFAYTGNVK